MDRVIHNRGEVSAKTAERVKLAIKQLGYQPNLIARSLATKQTHTLSVFLPDSKNTSDYWHYPIQGVRQAIEEITDHGLDIQYHFFDLNSQEDFLQKSEEVIARKPEVVITAPIFEAYQSQILTRFDQAGIRYVLIDSDIPQSGRISFVGQHAERSGQVAARLIQGLSETSRGQVLITNLFSGPEITPVIQKRIEGFKKYMQEKTPHVVVSELDINMNNMGSDSLKKHIDNHPVSAVFVPSSRAYLVVEYLQKHQIPDIKVVGYDLIERNIHYLSKGHIECLISQRPVKQGYHGIMALFNFLVKKETEQPNIILPIDIIIKENLDDYLSSIQL